jgi:L-threonylcarbamoyladenylate synthase
MIFAPDESNIGTVASLMLGGGIAIFPAGTVFGLGCLAENDAAVEKLARIKGRGRDKAFLLNLPDVSAIGEIAIVGGAEEKIMAAFMPGALSLVLRARADVRFSPLITRNEEIGIRIPNDKVLQKLLRRIGKPVVSTSCNKSGEPQAPSAMDAEKIFPDIPVLDAAEPLSGRPSTIARIRDGRVEIMREGAVSATDIEKILTRFPR